ncbi:MAG TPA: FixH family protein [Rhodopila sp.]|nr:FixH family protein [Rhodopila sp.]
MSTQNSAWRWFPHGLAGAMAIAFAVNGYMVYDAVTTFPGAAGTDGFDLSNHYDRVLSAKQRQAALGWMVDAKVGADHFPVLHLTDRNGVPLVPAAIEAQAERPVGPKSTTALSFKPHGNGLYQAETSLFSGQWDIMLTIRSDGRLYSTTRRVVVR